MILESKFHAAWWLMNCHLQTIWGAVFSKTLKQATHQQRLELDDGDFIDLEWLSPKKDAPNTPILLLLHGLEGSIDSSYIQGLLQVSADQNWNTVVMHFRGCSQELNRLPRSYHSGETDDLQQVLTYLKRQNPESKILTAGFSLGGNVLLKYLGETGDQSMIDYAAAISVPFLLAPSSERLDKGLSKFYRNRLIIELKKKIKNKYDQLPATFPLSLSNIDNISTFYEFDDQVTAPLNGFNGADDYYQQSSSRQFLKLIKAPTLILHSSDDPFMTDAVIPAESELSSSVTMELSARGGHVGFITGRNPLKPEYYIDIRIPSWFNEQLLTNE